MREQEQRDADQDKARHTREQEQHDADQDKARHTREQEQRDAEARHIESKSSVWLIKTKQGT